MRGGLTGRTLAASALLVAAVAAIFALLIVEIENERAAAGEARRTVTAGAAANQVERLIVDLQTGQRGFIITGEERFLEPWTAARAALPGAIDALAGSLRNEEQRARAAAIERDVEAYLSEWSEPLVALARVDRAAAAERIATGDGQQRIGALRAAFAELGRVQDEIAAGAKEKADAAASRARWLGIGGLAGSTLLVLLFAGWLARAVVTPVRRLSAVASRLAGGDLSARVPERGAGEVAELGQAFNAMAAAVEAGQEELDRFFTLSLELLGIAGTDGYFKRVNPAFERTLGYPAETFLSKPFLDLVHPDDREATLAEVAKLSGGGDVMAFENRYRCLDGSYRWILWNSAAVPDEGLIYATGRDITERKLGEERLAALNSELEHQNVELESQSGELEQQTLELEAQQAELERTVTELAEEKELVEVFYRFGELLAAEVEPKPLAALVLRELADFAGAEIGALHALDEEREDGFALAAARGLEASRLPARLHPGDGLAGRALLERRGVLASHDETALRLETCGEEVSVRHELHVPLLHGERALGVVSLARVADRPFTREEREAIEHLAEQAAIALANVLAYQRAIRLVGINRAVLDATVDGIRLVDLEGRTILANAAIERLTTEVFELPADSSLQERVAITDRLTDPSGFLATMEAIAADPECETRDEWELADSGRSFTRHTAPVRDSSGALIGRIVHIREVTAERQAEQLKSDLVATVSHELRTPLTSILGFTELLVTRDVEPDTRARYLDTIHRETRRLTDLVNDFLDLQRIEEGRFEVVLEPLELGELIREEVELYSAQSDRHALELDVPAEPLVVLGERRRLGQVLGNLLSNAIKYSPAGGPVRVAAEARDGIVRVSVEDSGLGIATDQQHKVFAKFFRLDSPEVREIGGTGLGLALCREIVEAHGGRIGLESVEGEGSTFWFELPLAERGLEGGRRRVLVIEDDPAAASLLSEYLAEEDIVVDLVATGEAGLERMATNPPALVCLDIRLAGELDGWEVLARLKADPVTAHVPVVVCTAGNNRAEAASLGAADFLTKPCSSRRLRETVTRLLPRRDGSVLVVDDEEDVRRLVVESLAGLGLELAEAADGEAALAAVAERRPDVIVLDLMMPELDGFAVLERLQDDAETRSIAVVVLTGRHLSRDERAILQRRAVSVLEKSDCPAAELRRLVRQALGRPGPPSS